MLRRNSLPHHASERWTPEPLGRIGKWLSGGTPRMSNPEFWDGDIPWVSPKDMKRRRLWNTVDHVTVNALGNGTRLAPAHSLLLVVRGMILAHTFPVARAEVPLAFNQDIKALVPRQDVDSDFLLWWLTANESLLLGITTESTHGTKRVPMDGLYALAIHLPELAEQRAIAAALSDVDALLGGLDRLIAKKRDLKQAAMQQLLSGQTRLPGFHGEWEVKQLGDLAEIVSGGTPRTDEPSYWNGGIKWCTPTDITRYAGKYLTETERTISRDGLDNSGATLLPIGALLLCSRATIGEVKIAAVPICTNQGFKSLVCRPETSIDFLYYKLLTMKQQMMERAFGSTFLEISTRNVHSLAVAAPSPEEQAAMATVLSDMDTELAALEARRDKTRALKQAMMQELLTGRTRLV